MAKNVPNLMQVLNLQIQQPQWTKQDRMKTLATLSHIMMKMLNMSDKLFKSWK